MPEASGLSGFRVPRLVRVAEAASFLIPWFAALGASSPASRFSDDVPLIRSLGLVPLGFEGLVSTGLGSAFDFLPIGSRALRLSWVAALGLGVFSFVLYRVTLACQLAARKVPRTDETSDGASETPVEVALALAAALAATVGPIFLTEGSTPGGFSVGAALALGSVAIGTRVLNLGQRTPLVLGASVAATLLESRWAAFAALFALTLHALIRRGRVTQMATLSFGAGALAWLMLPVVLLALAWAAPSPGLELSWASISSAPARVLRVEQSAALSAWASSVGLLWCGLSVAGLGLGLFRASTRPRVLPLAAFVLFDAMVSADVGPGVRDPHGAVRLLGVATLALSGALAVSSAIHGLYRARIPFSRAASTLLVVYGFTLVFVSAEQSARAALSRELGAADAVTDEVLGSLPASAVVLVRSEPIFLRMLSWQLARGSRPDVLAVSMPLIERAGSQAEALSHEDGLVPLVRDMLLSGRPSEFALSALADTRPLYVEPDLSWDPRLFGHLVPRPFFAEFAPHPLGRSDRRLGLEQAASAGKRLASALRATEDGDPATRALLVTQLGQRAVVLSALGDREEASDVVRELLSLDPQAPLGLRLKSRLEQPGRGPIDVGEPFAVR